MEIFYRSCRREIGYNVADSIFVFQDGTVIQDISYSTKYGPRSLQKLELNAGGDGG